MDWTLKEMSDGKWMFANCHGAWAHLQQLEAEHASPCGRCRPRDPPQRTRHRVSLRLLD